MTEGAGATDRRLGVVGTLVWDILHPPPPDRGEAVEQWGGLAYALSAFEAAGPTGWGLVPIVKVGRDLRERAGELLGRLDRVLSLEGVRFVDAPNNRVEIRYRDREHRTEHLRGGVPGWSWEELGPLAARCDALYVNFIAGWEMGLDAARRLRGALRGPLYADLHSLFLDVGPDGIRRPRSLERGAEWVSCFDLVQVNETELRLLAGQGSSPWEAARRAVDGGPTRAVLVTRGERGARWFAAPGFRGLDRAGGAGAESGGPPASREPGDGSPREGDEPPEETVRAPDPTGCGDVWGITCFGALLAGADLGPAVRRANRVAAQNARGTGGIALLPGPGGESGTEGREGT